MIEDPAAQGGWHLDKRVPIALILTIVLQTSVGIWWAATQTARIDANTRAIMRLENSSDGVPARLSRIETRQEYMLQTIERIDRKLEDTQ